MSKSIIILRQTDTVNVANKDSNTPFLDLMKVEDSSGVVVKKKIKKNSVAVPVLASPIPVAAVDTLVQDSVVFELSNTNKIPIRKTIKSEKTIAIEQQEVVLAFTKAFGLNRFRQIYKSLFSYYSAHEVVREEKVFFHQVNFSLFLVYLFTISLLLYFAATYIHPNNIQPFLYPVILGMVMVAYSIKFLFNSILGYLFDYSQHVPTYTYNVLLYNYLLGILLIPSLALVYFSDFPNFQILNFIILPLISIILLIRFVRFFAIGISNNVSYLYIILYICTLEILPLFVVIKAFTSRN